jgi:integrase
VSNIVVKKPMSIPSAELRGGELYAYRWSVSWTMAGRAMPRKQGRVVLSQVRRDNPGVTRQRDLEALALQLAQDAQRDAAEQLQAKRTGARKDWRLREWFSRCDEVEFAGQAGGAQKARDAQRYFLDTYGDWGLDSFSKLDAKDWWRWLSVTPFRRPYYSKKHPDRVTKLGPARVLPLKTRLNIAAEVSSYFSAAVDAELIERNPMHFEKCTAEEWDAHLAQVEERKVYLADEQFAALDRLAAGSPYRDAVAAMADTGLRPSEALGIWLDDVDLDADVIHVTRKRRGNEDVRVLKSRASARVLPLSPRLRRMAERRHGENMERAEKGLPVYPNLVVHGETGEPLRGDTVGKRLKSMVEQVLGEPVPPGKNAAYVLRRTTNEQLDEAGLGTEARAKLLGHTPVVNEEAYRSRRRRNAKRDEALRQAFERKWAAVGQ